jgi:DNA-binding transcriptional LysR family regulator
MDRIRSLDIDDLRILRFLLQGLTVTEIARRNFVTQPAISQRLRKMEWVFGSEKLVFKSGRSALLGIKGKEIAQRADWCLKVLEEFVGGTK